MNKELIGALDALEKEKGISKDILIEAIENSLITGCKQHFGITKDDGIVVRIDRNTGDFRVFITKRVVEHVEDPVEQISLEDAVKINSKAQIGNGINVEIKSEDFSRIAAQKAKGIILQRIREEERKSVYSEYAMKEKDIVTGIVQRINGDKISINLGKMDAVLLPKEQVKGEVFVPTERIKLYVVSVTDTAKGVIVKVSRSHPDLVKRLFESEVTEVKDGTVEIKGIAREAGSRTKMAVRANVPNVDPVGACVGINGARVKAIVNELGNEQIDIIEWDSNSAQLIVNALSPAKVIAVMADPDEKTAKVVVPDYQLSLAIGKEGQNARLAARLTGFKIDIKSESQAREAGEYEGYNEESYDDDAEYSENMNDALPDEDIQDGDVEEEAGNEELE